MNNSSRRLFYVLGERSFYLCISSITAKDEKIAHFEEILSAKDKEIADLKEKLSELQQQKEADFAKQLNTMDEELRETKENIFRSKENILKKKAEVENISNEVKLFNGKWLP